MNARSTAPDRAQRLRELARRLERLTVSRRDPERFFEERSNLIDELREISDEMKTTHGRTKG